MNSVPTSSERLWDGLRLVVFDVETTPSPNGGPWRVVSLAAVTCRLGAPRGSWHTLVNPEVPITARSTRIHGITDDLVQTEPTFADIAAQVRGVLEPHKGERVVLGAHNAAFDVSVLRGELARLGSDLPDVALLDTMGKLPALVGVQPDNKTLTELLRALDLVNPQPHQALADAQSCALAACSLLDRAAALGLDDLDELLAAIRAKTAHAIAANRHARAIATAGAAVSLSAQHIEGHSNVLGPRPSTKQLWVWAQQVRECAELRCEHLAERASQAQAPIAKRVAELEDVLGDLIEAPDTPGAATVLDALLALFVAPNRIGAGLWSRDAALRWEKRWGPRLRSLGRCGEDDQCPACRRGDPCALDLWPEVLAGLALGEVETAARGLLRTEGAQRGKGVYTTWRSRGVDSRVGDAAIWLVVEHLRSSRHEDRAVALERQAWVSGCRQPDLASDYAGRIAAAGRETDLTQALAVCDAAFSTRDGSTAPGWTRLLSRRQQIAGRLQCLASRQSSNFDENGNPLATRPHTATNPRRVRAPRFARP